MKTRMASIVFACSMLFSLSVGYALGTRHAFAPARAFAADDCQTFKETGKTVCGAFLQYWTANGALAQQGFPVSDMFSEKSETDGKTYQVQYFERAVFEMHPELPAGSNVLLTLLGAQKYKTRYNGTQPSGTSAPLGVTAAVPTASVVATAVPVTTSAPSSTPKPTTVPTATPVPATTVPVSMEPSDLTAYSQYLQTKFAKYGSHTIGIKKVTVSQVGNDGYAVTFQVTNDEALYLLTNAHKSDLQPWGAALLSELKAHFPGNYVAGTLEDAHYSFTPGTKSDCHYVDLENFDVDLGWYVANDFVHVSHFPSTGGLVVSSSDDVNVCFAK